MSTSEILEQLGSLPRADRAQILQRLEELEMTDSEETPEELAAIDEGRAAIRAGKTHTVEEARKMITKWTTKSS